MGLQIPMFLFWLTIVCMTLLYFVAGLVASDRLAQRSVTIEKVITSSNLAFVFTVVLWPLVGFFGLLYFGVVKRFN